MGLKEDDIRDLGDGLEFGEEIKPQPVGTDCGLCQTCQSSKLSPNGCSGCEKCQTNTQQGCSYGQNSCDTTCQNGWQDLCGVKGSNEGSCGKCQACQTPCQNSSQCGRCESNYQCNYCEYGQCGSCESCQTPCQSSTQCSSTCEKSCQTGAQTNTAPSVPASIAVPSTIKGGDTILIQWGTSTDSNLTGYILQKKTDGGSYVQIYKGASRSFSDTVAAGTNKVQYRVKAYDSYGAESGYRTSNEVIVTNNSAPIISGKDTDLGGQKAPFKIDVSVSDKDLGDQIDLIAKLNGSTIKTIKNAAQNTNYEIEIDASRFNALVLNARNEVEISATDSKATSYRRYYFTRINAAPTIDLPATNLGTQNQPFEFKYTIKDAEGDPTGVRILYGDKVLENIKSVKLDTEQTFKFKKLDFAQIPAGDISIKIEATDDKGGVSNRLVSFIKEINGCGYVYKKETPAKATQIIVTVSATVDEKSTLKVSVCNNANDSSPAWEEITDQLDKIYNIKNTSKTASKWALGVKTEIIRGKDAGDSYLDAVGINFR